MQDYSISGQRLMAKDEAETSIKSKRPVQLPSKLGDHRLLFFQKQLQNKLLAILCNPTWTIPQSFGRRLHRDWQEQLTLAFLLDLSHPFLEGANGHALEYVGYLTVDAPNQRLETLIGHCLRDLKRRQPWLLQEAM
mmetsp:Transcript_35797/g.93917  ORF Transcript_35797/g.93917 Transcript_35797/m.93917 type:complete len:136 (+) Transcript_35797:1894-2301(+)